MEIDKPPHSLALFTHAIVSKCVEHCEGGSFSLLPLLFDIRIGFSKMSHLLRPLDLMLVWPVCVWQTLVLGILMRSIGNKNTILLGLGFQILQLAWYGFGSQHWSVTPQHHFNADICLHDRKQSFPLRLDCYPIIELCAKLDIHYKTYQSIN